MKVVAVIAQKGGAGKTTLALSLAVAAHRDRRSVLVIDLDPQATASKWSDRREDKLPVVTSGQAARLPKLLDAAREGGADLVFIDTPPRVEQASLLAGKAADLILIPCLPTISDLETLNATMELLKYAGQTEALVILNGVPARGTTTEDAEKTVTGMSIPVAPLSLGYRTAYRNAPAFGLTAQEYDPHGKAAQEIKQLYKFIAERVNTLTPKQENTYAPEARLAASH
jgi:chromosome partitioning protein